MIYCRHRLQSAAKLIAFTVIAQDGNRANPSNPQGDQVIDNGPGRSRAATNPNNLIGVQAGLQGQLGQGSVQVEIPVEKQVPHDPDRQG